MLQAGNGLSFTFETDSERLVVLERSRQDLYGYFAFEERIVGPVDGGHTAAIQFIFDPITADFC